MYKINTRYKSLVDKHIKGENECYNFFPERTIPIRGREILGT